MKISNSKLDTFVKCGKKFQFRYIDNLKGNFTASALLFGSAIDNSLNYILESIRDKKEWNAEYAKDVFITYMNIWDGSDRLDFFKGDVPDSLKDAINEDSKDFQEQVWGNLCERGIACIDVYIKEVLPLIDEVLKVQENISTKNSEDDELVGVVDFIAKLKDGRTVLFDNKTASKKYAKNKVVTSQQLSLYLESFPEIKLAGYIVLLKNPEEGKPAYQLMVDEIPEETKQQAFDLLESSLYDIKNSKFEPNPKSCFAFGKPCEYWKLCKQGNAEGLVPVKREKK